jgi:flagellar basal-body rod protein FlgG
MIRALNSAATGMRAQQLEIDTISNNLANVNTTGFKKSRTEFQDLIYQTLKAVGASSSGLDTSPAEVQVGHGTRTIATQKDFSQGEPVPTENPLDLNISGVGFFQVYMPDGTLAYTRDGSFKLSADGLLVTSDGYAMEPEIMLPQDTASISIDTEGLVSVILIGETEPQEVGQIELARFMNPAGLTNLGQNLFQPTAASGDPIVGAPGSQGFGTVMQGYLEGSNVSVVEEMVNMIVAQRAYEINSKAIKTAEDMLAVANNLKR